MVRVAVELPAFAELPGRRLLQFTDPGETLTVMDV
jgi:hypothetical protein